MNPDTRDKRVKRDLHFLDYDGMVACNRRDLEAAHRAQVEGIATEYINSVTCKKCWGFIKENEIYRNQV
ncbi:MAG: hypothetical protein GY770_18690 [Aestuariibacter sp.]|nr:hypothetical protein [Aestuariibacter sp.]